MSSGARRGAGTSHLVVLAPLILVVRSRTIGAVQAVRYVLGRWNWRRRVALLALVVLAAGALSFVLLAALGAHRADGAWDRLQGRSRADDLLLDVTSLDAARATARQLTTIPGVERAA